MKKNRLLPSFRRNLRRLMMPVAVCSVGLIAASCSTDDNVTLGEPLPEGMYPIEFTATGLQATPQTRATVDGYWNEGDNVAIQIGEDVKQYKAKSSGSTTELTPADAGNQFYWQSTNDVIVQAWYPYNNNVIPETWEVSQNQYAQNQFLQGDFLYAQDKFMFGSTNALHFFHQTAMVVVHILNGNQTPKDITVKDMTIGPNLNISLKAKWTAPKECTTDNSNAFGTWSGYSNSNEINPYSRGQQPVDGRRSLASYEAFVIPQTINAGEKLFRIGINGYDSFYYTVPGGGITWQPGIKYTYYITIEGTKLSVTTNNSSIGWGTGGANGSGSVVLPPPIGDKEAKDAAIGDFYMSDGTLVDSKATLTDAQKAACIGIVFYVDEGGTSGKIVSLDESSQYWSTGTAQTGANSDIDGLANMATTKNLSSDFSGYPAFKWVYDNHNGASVTYVSGAKNVWYLPAKEELTTLYNNRNAVNTTLAAINARKIELSSDPYYWSSTERDGEYAWFEKFNNGSKGGNVKNFDSYRVRAVLAF